MSELKVLSIYSILKGYIEQLDDVSNYPDLRKKAIKKAVIKIEESKDSVQLHLLVGNRTEIPTVAALNAAFKGERANFISVNRDVMDFVIEIISDELKISAGRILRSDLDKTERLRVQEIMESTSDIDLVVFDINIGVSPTFQKNESLPSLARVISKIREMGRLEEDSWLYIDYLFDVLLDKDNRGHLCKVRDLNKVIAYCAEIAKEYGVHVVLGFYSEDLPIEDTLEWYEPRAKIIEVILEDEPSPN